MAQFVHPAADVVDALDILGTCQWSRLRRFAFYSVPGIFETHINLDSCPEMARLVLFNKAAGPSLGRGDVAAMNQASRLTSNLKSLYMGSFLIEDGLDIALKNLFGALPRLERLTLSAAGLKDLGFLAADLPNFKYLKLYDLSAHVHLGLIVAVPRLRLHTLHLPGAADPAPVLSSGPAALPALRHLKIRFHHHSVSSMRLISMPTLESLSIRWDVSRGGATASADIAAGLARLPALEILQLDPERIPDEQLDDFLSPYIAELSVPRLRRLELGRDCQGSDDTLEDLIDVAHNIPQLEEIRMLGGDINSQGCTALAEAGRRGLWPRLNFIGASHFVVIEGFKDRDEEFCLYLVHEVWPDLVLQWGFDFDPHASDYSDGEG